MKTDQLGGTYINDTESLKNIGNYTKNCTRQDSELPMQERIMSFVVSCFKWLHVTNHVDNVGSATNVKNLHHCVVQGIIGCKQVEVSSNKNNQI